MKFPTLTKILAVFLALCCLGSLTGGIYGLNKAPKLRDADLKELDFLREMAEDYHSLDLALSGDISPQEALEDIAAREAQHSEDAEKHKKELTEYSAVKGGVSMGSEAIEDAEAMLKETEQWCIQGEEMLLQYEAEYEDMVQFMAEASEKYQQGEQLYTIGHDSLYFAWDMIYKLYALDDLIESGDPDANLNLSVDAYSKAIYLFEQGMDAVRQLELQGVITAEQSDDIEGAVILVTGMTSNQLLELLYSSRDEILENGGGLSQAEFEIIKAAYERNRALIMSAASSVESFFVNLEQQLMDMRIELDMAAQQLSMGEEMMIAAAEGLNSGREMLRGAQAAKEKGEIDMAQAKAELDMKLMELDEELGSLKDEKSRLSQESKDLEQQRQEAEEQLELQNERDSLGFRLRGNEEINSAFEGGTELYSAVTDYIPEETARIFRIYKDSLTVCIMMIAGSVMGFAALFGIFGKNRSRGKRLIFPILCFVILSAAALLSETQGLDRLESAISSAAMSLILIISAIPDKKKTAAA